MAVRLTNTFIRNAAFKNACIQVRLEGQIVTSSCAKVLERRLYKQVIEAELCRLEYTWKLELLCVVKANVPVLEGLRL